MAKLDTATRDLVVDFILAWDPDEKAADWEIIQKLRDLGISRRTDIQDIMGIYEACKILKEEVPPLRQDDPKYILQQLRVRLNSLNTD